LFKCKDCQALIELPSDIQQGEIVSCSCCGLEYEYKNGNLVELEIEGEDYGE
jgi:DNA-directed RNA polymerase subunit M/transcription elongation factor TFIIS